MLKALGITPYHRLNVHGYWNIDEGKMSKSRGTVIKPLDLKDKYGLDAFRYYLLREMVFGLDSNFSEEGFVLRLNSDLANDLGNLVSRSLTMASRYCDGKVPPASAPADEDHILIDRALKLLPEVEESFRGLQFHKALLSIWEFVGMTNKYIVAQEPWTLSKDPDKKDRLQTVLYTVLEAIRFISVLVSPVMPDGAAALLRRLGIQDPSGQDFESIRSWGVLEPGNPLTVGEALFPRVQWTKKEEEKVRKLKDVKPEISLEDFARVDLRVARVLEAEPVPRSDKLVKLKIDVGEERTIVAGMGKDYRPEDLVGRQIAVVVNLKPAKLMGVESHGMLLATDREEGLALVAFDGDVRDGAKIR